MSLEAQDYAKLNEEQKEQDDREFHENAKAEFNQALEGCICQAHKDGLTYVEIIESMKDSFENCEDGIRINIERMI